MIVKYTFLFFFTLLSATIIGQIPGKQYADGHGGSILLPQGDISFADEVVSFKRGVPQALEEACDSILSLGLPDFKGGLAEHFTSLGCGGVLSLRFIDNAIINIPGPDLFVFEVGKYIETTQLYISKDGNNWINVGIISGGVTAVDIGDSVKQSEIFHYVKLVDLETDCKGNWPGADIDAVAAIGSGGQISINNGVLYKSGEFQLIAGAKTILDSIVNEVRIQKPSQIVIEGHTDDTGVENQNQVLSEKRAKSVKDYLTQKLSPIKVGIRIIGYGSKLPLASNETKEGQNLNRRVCIILIP